MVVKNCKNCEKEIPNRNVFCDNLCQNDYQTKNKIKRWLEGENFLRSDGLIIPQWIRNYLLEECKFKCNECSWSEINKYTGKAPLEVDHIDGDAKNNLRDNLRILCPNCHSLTKTFKNIGARKSSRIRK